MTFLLVDGTGRILAEFATLWNLDLALSARPERIAIEHPTATIYSGRVGFLDIVAGTNAINATRQMQKMLGVYDPARP